MKRTKAVATVFFFLLSILLFSNWKNSILLYLKPQSIYTLKQGWWHPLSVNTSTSSCFEEFPINLRVVFFFFFLEHTLNYFFRLKGIDYLEGFCFENIMRMLSISYMYLYFDIFLCTLTAFQFKSGLNNQLALLYTELVLYIFYIFEFFLRVVVTFFFLWNTSN